MSYTAHLQSTNTKLILKGYFSGIDEAQLLNKIKNNTMEYEIPTYSKSAYSEKIKKIPFYLAQVCFKNCCGF